MKQWWKKACCGGQLWWWDFEEEDPHHLKEPWLYQRDYPKSFVQVRLNSSQTCIHTASSPPPIQIKKKKDPTFQFEKAKYQKDRKKDETLGGVGTGGEEQAEEREESLCAEDALIAFAARDDAAEEDEDEDDDEEGNDEDNILALSLSMESKFSNLGVDLGFSL